MSTQPDPHPRRWAGLGVLSASLLIVVMDMTILNVALPELARDLEPTSVELLWIVDAYSLVVAGLLVTAAALADRLGRRRVLVAGYVIFGSASVLIAVVDSATALIALRALLGVGGAMILPATLSLLRITFTDERERGVALGVWAALAAGGAGIGPIVGGALLEAFSWQAAFLINVPLMAIAIVAAFPLLPESRSDRPGIIDTRGVLLSVVGMAALVYAIKDFGKDGVGLVTLLAGGPGLLALALFVRRALRAEQPMLDVRLLLNRRIRAGTITATSTMIASGILFLLATQHLQLVEGQSALVAGISLLPYAAASMLASLVAPLLAERTSPRIVLTGGLLVGATGFALLFVLQLSLVTLLGVMTIVGTGAGTLSVASALIMSNTPADKAGSAAAIEETSYDLGMVLSVSILGSLATAVYRAGLPGDAAPRVRESLAGAVGDPVFASAAAAFENGLAWTGLTGAVVIAASAAAVWRLTGPARDRAAPAVRGLRTDSGVAP